jgi:hypothetical protein
MDSFELDGIGSDLELMREPCLCDHNVCAHQDTFSPSLSTAHVANGMDPIQASMHVLLDAAPIEPLLPCSQPYSSTARTTTTTSPELDHDPHQAHHDCQHKPPAGAVFRRAVQPGANSTLLSGP